jgi:hypothetical protein
VGSSTPGALAFSVEPSAAAAVEPPAAADGEVGVCVVPLQAARVATVTSVTPVFQKALIISKTLLKTNRWAL